MGALRISAVARMTAEHGPVVQLSLDWPGMALQPVLSLHQAQTAYDQIGAAIAAIKLGTAYSAGTDPRDVERRYRAKLAVRLGLSRDDIRAVFDVTEADIERLAAEVAQ